MDRLAKMQQWAAGQSTSQYGNNPWVQAMMRFMGGLKGNYGSSASGWGGGTLNAGQQAQAPAPKPPAQQAQAPAPKPPAQETSWATPRGEDGNTNVGTSNQTSRSGGQISPGDDWRSRFAEEISKLPITDRDHLGMPVKGGNGWDYSAMPAGKVSTSTKSAPTLGYPSGITDFGPDNIMRVTSIPGVIGKVYPQEVADYMMARKPNSSGQWQGV